MIILREKIFMSPAMLGIGSGYRPDQTKKRAKQKQEYEELAEIERKRRESVETAKEKTSESANKRKNEYEKLVEAEENRKKEVDKAKESAKTKENPTTKTNKKTGFLKKVKNLYTGKSKYGKKGQLLAIGGTTLAAAGGTVGGIGLYKKIKRNKEE